ncbi:MAG: preprotein translocase subunit SecA [Flavobacteriales bacterium]|nr:preprotein translocase subunit SecA [Flavobacteriales bacterium]
MIGSIGNVITKLFGKKSDKDVKDISPLVNTILQEQEKLKNVSADDLRSNSDKFRLEIQEYIKPEDDKIKKIKNEADKLGVPVKEKEELYKQIDEINRDIDLKIEEVLNKILPKAFANIRETARRFKDNETIEVKASEYEKSIAHLRDNFEIQGDKAIYSTTWEAGGNEIKWDMEHYQVQLVGGVVLHSGKIGEMATGEGKTLVATLPVYLNALAKKGVHLVTVNDYLATRDCEWMRPLFEFHSLSIDCIDKYQPNSEQRRAAYNCDVTYGTNNEFGFDYLRDNMASDVDDLVQRKHHYAIVDEVDSVLIDDARTPLIISGQMTRKTNMEFDKLKPFVNQLVQAQRQLVTKKLAEAKKLFKDENSKDSGIEILRAHRGLPKNKALIKFLSQPGAKQLLQKTENNYMQEQGKNMHVVDDELFFVIDEKANSIELKDKGVDLISQSVEDKDFFVMPDLGSMLAGVDQMSGTDQEKAQAKTKVTQEYSVKVERLHTMQQLLKAFTLFEKEKDYVVMDNAVKIVDESTGRIMDGRRWSDGLHQAVEAKEGVKIEAASQTYASVTLQNYFRMYHKLCGMTGTAITEAAEFWDIYKLDVIEIPTNRPIVRDDRNDKVYKTQREKFNAVIEEIGEITKQGRPILVGTTSVEISELLSRTLKMRGIRHNVLNAKRHGQEAQIVREAGQAHMVTIATNMAGRGTDIKLSDEVKSKGGLAIIATERHESRRVDRQLRGRSGRQGDPGSSQFFVALEDPLMRLFGSERISKLMDRMGLKEGEVIQHSMISKSIERAQKKVEENNFGMRKRLLEYDDILNAQREVIYTKRRNALYGDRLSVDVSNMFMDAIEVLVLKYSRRKDFDSFKVDLITQLGIESPLTIEEFEHATDKVVFEAVAKKVSESYKAKKDSLALTTLPFIKDVYENQGGEYASVNIPFTNGKKILNISVNIKKGYESSGQEVIKQFERGITLAIIDENWKEHLREMDDLRTNVQNASVEQKDPLLIYKRESYDVFLVMMDKINSKVASFLMKAGILQQDPNQQNSTRLSSASKPASTPKVVASRGDVNGVVNEETKKPILVEKTVGRNDPCPCGNGKKYKQCCGKV